MVMNSTIKYTCFLWLSFFSVTTTMAQMISSDQNWNTTPLFYDNFNPTRSNWDANWFDYPNDYKWRAHLITGVTHGDGEHQVYRRENAIMDATDSTLKLRAAYAGGLIQADTIILPPNYPNIDSAHTSLYYYSGAVTALQTFQYGYFEGRMKLPANQGAFPAFWLFNVVNNDYQEIDIFEVSWLFNPSSSRKFFGGMFANYNHISGNPLTRYDAHNYTIPTSDPDITNWHTYGLEWSPKRCVWYFDGEVIGELLHDSVPIHPMYLMINYALDDQVISSGNPIQTGFPNDMIVDYVSVNKLQCNCTSDVSILNTTQLTNYVYEVKKSITIDGNGTTISLPSSSSSVFRATDYLLIDTDFEVPLGSALELTTHACPQ